MALVSIHAVSTHVVADSQSGDEEQNWGKAVTPTHNMGAASRQKRRCKSSGAW